MWCGVLIVLVAASIAVWPDYKLIGVDAPIITADDGVGVSAVGLRGSDVYLKPKSHFTFSDVIVFRIFADLWYKLNWRRVGFPVTNAPKIVKGPKLKIYVYRYMGRHAGVHDYGASRFSVAVPDGLWGANDFLDKETRIGRDFSWPSARVRQEYSKFVETVDQVRCVSKHGSYRDKGFSTLDRKVIGLRHSVSSFLSGLHTAFCGPSRRFGGPDEPLGVVCLLSHGTSEIRSGDGELVRVNSPAMHLAKLQTDNDNIRDAAENQSEREPSDEPSPSRHYSFVFKVLLFGGAIATLWASAKCAEYADKRRWALALSLGAFACSGLVASLSITSYAPSH